MKPWVFFLIPVVSARFGAPAQTNTPGSVGPLRLSEVTSTSLWPAPAQDTRTSSCNFTLLGKDVAATGSDCPYSGHGPDSSLSVCQSACVSAGGDTCTDINWNPSIPDCVFRRCENPARPNMTSAPGYSVYMVQRPTVVSYGVGPTTAFTFSLAPGSFTNEVLAAAMSRAMSTAFPYGIGSPSLLPGPTVSTLEIMVTSTDSKLRLGVDESYVLEVNPSLPSPATLTAPTIFGAIRGLETFSQVLSYNFTGACVPLRLSCISGLQRVGTSLTHSLIYLPQRNDAQTKHTPLRSLPSLTAPAFCSVV